MRFSGSTRQASRGGGCAARGSIARQCSGGSARQQGRRTQGATQAPLGVCCFLSASNPRCPRCAALQVDPGYAARAKESIAANARWLQQHGAPACAWVAAQQQQQPATGGGG